MWKGSCSISHGRKYHQKQLLFPPPPNMYNMHLSVCLFFQMLMFKDFSNFDYIVKNYLVDCCH